MLVRLDHIASRIMNADHRIMGYGRGAGVGRDLGDGASLGVGVGLGVYVGVGVGVVVGVRPAGDFNFRSSLSALSKCRHRISQ